jgi:hypothetical protein
MRNVISKLLAAVALVAASAAPAMACGGLFGDGCSPCQSYASPCGAGYQGGYGYAGVHERLPDPSRYYYANQGPSFSGPGNYAPVPTYQETALSGPRVYHRPNYGYSAQPAYRAPIVYSYPRVRPSYRYGYRMQPRYGYAHRSYAPRYGYYHQRRHFAGPRMMYAPRYAAPRHTYPHYNHRPMHRMY